MNMNRRTTQFLTLAGTALALAACSSGAGPVTPPADDVTVCSACSPRVGR